MIEFHILYLCNIPKKPFFIILTYFFLLSII